MLTSIELRADQILCLLAIAAGCDPDDVELGVRLEPCNPDLKEVLVSATIKTSFKGAERVQRALAKQARDLAALAPVSEAVGG